MPHFNSRAIGVMAALSMAMGCAGIEANRRSPGVLTKESFSPTRPAAANYGADPARPCPPGGAIQILTENVDEAAKSSGKPAPRPDGRLCAAADTLIGWDKAELPDETVVAFVSSYFGLTAPISRVIITTIESEDAKDIASRLVETVSSFGRTAAQPQFGLATQRQRKGATKLVLLMQDGPVDLDPLPRRLALNGQAMLSGRLTGVLENPKVLITDAAGKLERPTQPPGKSFRAELHCGDHPGLTQVQIRAEDKGAESIVASFPVACGADLPTKVALARGDEGTMDVSQQERKLLDMVNTERTGAGLPPLAWDDSVAQVARAAAESRRTNPSADVNMVERLKAVDVTSPVVLENPAQARSAQEAQARFSSSPPHRANFMSPEVTHAGVGIASSKEADGRSSVFVSEVFVKELPQVDADRLREKLRSAMAQKRADARAPAVAKDATLEQVAQQYAQELAAAKGTLAKARADELLAPLRKSYKTLNLLSGSRAEPLEFAEEPTVVSTGKVLGIGVAQGANPVLGKNAVYVVAIIGTRR